MDCNIHLIIFGDLFLMVNYVNSFQSDYVSPCSYLQGLEYILKHGLVENTPDELAKFIHTNRQLDFEKKREFLACRLVRYKLVF